MKLLLTIAVISITSMGCASTSGITPMGRGTYMIAKQAATGIGGLGNLKAEALQEADKHCNGMGKELEVVSTQENEGPFVFGKYPRAEVQFRCETARK